MKFKSFLSALFVACLFFSCAKEEIQLTDLTKEEVSIQNKMSTSPPPPSDCTTAFFAYRIPYNSSDEALITIVNANTGEVAAEFMGTGTLYNVDLDTNTEYYWVQNTRLDWFVDYCSCGDNLGTLSHGPNNSSFTTSTDDTNYTTCNF